MSFKINRSIIQPVFVQSKLSAESVELSRPMTLIVLDAVVGRTCVALDALFSKSMVSVRLSI